MRSPFAKAAGILVLLVGITVLGAAVATAAEDVQQARREPQRERAVGSGITLAVRVVDADGAAVEGARVSIVAVRGEERVRVTAADTDAEGRAVFELRAGGYEVHVRSDAGDAVERIRLHEAMRLPIQVGADERPARGA